MCSIGHKSRGVSTNVRGSYESDIIFSTCVCNFDELMIIMISSF